MRNRIIFALVALGILGGLASAYVYARPKKALPPAFAPSANPFAHGIYANGIIESDQANGENINLYTEVAGTVTRVLVTEGQHVARGAPLLELDDSVQRALVEQQLAQVEAARTVLDELRAQPRKETLEVARAQVDMAGASLHTAQAALDKQQRAYALDPRAVSKDALDGAVNAQKVAAANLAVATRQYELTRAGAWTYDVRNQQRQLEALTKAAAASGALLAKYTLRAPAAGTVLSIHATAGTYLSPQGGYDPYTQTNAPPVVMGNQSGRLAVRTYIDEILIPSLPPTDALRATMFIRGTQTSVPLEFVRVQPYVSPKIQLSNDRQERVDLRVLPLVFRFSPPAGSNLYPGQLVDVYVAAK